MESVSVQATTINSEVVEEAVEVDTVVEVGDVEVQVRGVQEVVEEGGGVEEVNETKIMMMMAYCRNLYQYPSTPIYTTINFDTS